ncbi:carbon starvation protein A [bacterium]|nr:carbon starvation protein A [bacterium]
MNHPLLVFCITSLGFWVAYHTYGRYLAKKIFKLDKHMQTPAHKLNDGSDFVPSSRQVMFGHHFTSIAGTGPIVGPAIGIIWGWLPACLWIVFGSIFMGAVHDFGALVISMRNNGRSLSDIAGDIIHPRVRLFFYIIVCLSLWIVIAIFGLVIALIFKQFPESVWAVWLEIPIAIAFGYSLKRKGSLLIKTAIAVSLLYGCVYLGMIFPVSLPMLGSLPVTGLWTLILLVYACIASLTPVSLLLQPRDYINAWQLYVALGLIICGLVVSGLQGSLHFVAPAVNLSPIGAPSLWPFLFITIACGALSGFHCLVCSGTSSKQINSETDAQLVGYGSMLIEALLAIVIIIAVGAGIGMAYTSNGITLTGIDAFSAHYGTWEASSGLGAKLSAVVIGCANMMGSIGIPLSAATAIVGVFIASFAGTTLDSATRVQRYVISECAKHINIKPVQNKYGATIVAVISAALLAFSSGMNGKGALALWPLFGAVNQLLGGLALLVITLYISKRVGQAGLIAGIPCILVMIMTLWATWLNHNLFIQSKAWLLVIINGILLLLAIAIIMEGIRHFIALFKSKHIFKRTKRVRV